MLWRGWRDELHVGDLVHDAVGLTQSLLDVAHRNLLLVLAAVQDDSDAALVEAHDDLHHTQCLVQGAVVVMLREGVLLEEFILDDLGGL